MHLANWRVHMGIRRLSLGWYVRQTSICLLVQGGGVT